MHEGSPSVLVATVGGQPQLITLCLDILLERDKRIRDVVPVYLPGPRSRSQAGLRKIMDEFPHDQYRGQTIHLRPQPVRSDKRAVDDIRDESDADVVWRTLHELLGSLKQQEKRVHLCVGGGKRVMSLLAISAAMLHFGHHDRVWHINTSDDFAQRADEGAIMHAEPDDDVRLIQVPLVPWGAYFPGVRNLLNASPAEVMAVQIGMLDEVDRRRCAAVLERLTKRPTEALWAFADGATPDGVAEALSIVRSTVDSHKTLILAECRVAWNLPENSWLDYHFIRDKFGKMKRSSDKL